MSYGHSSPTVFVPLTFVCKECGVIVTIQVDAGKDYIWEDTVREGERYMIAHCGWYIEWTNTPIKTQTHPVLCAACKQDDD